jgi:glycosyltransferase involved in cell wall biosynthesis
LTVAFINSTRKWGGVKTWTLDFGSALRDRGHKIVALVRPGTPFVAACRDQCFTVHEVRFGPKYNPVAIARLVGTLRQERADLAVVNISKDLDVGAVAARMCRLPVLHRVGLLEDYRNTVEERLHFRFLVDHVLVPGRWMKQELLKSVPWLRAERITAIPNAKRLGGYPARAPSDPGCVTFGITSQLSPSKGHTEVFSALRTLVAKGLSVRLRVAGAGGSLGHLQEETRRLGIESAVEFCGFQRDVPGFLSTLDIFVLASSKEGFPNTLLEALCAGLPVVAYGLEGVREMVEDVGLTVAVGNQAQLADGMEQLARNAPVRTRLGAAARKLAAERYDVTQVVLRLETLLRRLERT